MHRDCSRFFYSEAVWSQSFETQERKRKTGYKWIDDVHHRHLQQQKQHHCQTLHAAYLLHMRKEGKMEMFPEVMVMVMICLLFSSICRYRPFLQSRPCSVSVSVCLYIINQSINPFNPFLVFYDLEP